MVARWKLRELHRIISRQRSIRGVVEVGTGHGALTVLVAKALERAGADFHMFTFDKIVGGSREAYGNFQFNTTLIQDNLRHFGIHSRVTPVFRDVIDAHAIVERLSEIDLLVLDADGRIDRDLMLFWDRLAPNCMILLDDAVGGPTLGRPSLVPYAARAFRIDGKHWITAHIVSHMIQDGFLEPISTLGDFLVMRRASAASTPDAEYFLNVYRNLIPATANFSGNSYTIVVPSVRAIGLWVIRNTIVGKLAYRRYSGSTT